MKNATVVDKDYGSVSIAELEALKEQLAVKDIDLSLAHCRTEDEIIAAAKE